MPEPERRPPIPSEEGAACDDEERCEICGAPMVAIHCKLRCPNCGRTRDCSDP